MKFHHAVALLLAAALPGVAAAQTTVQSMLMEQAGVDPDVLRPSPSVRLAGMGDLSLAVADEGNEISLRDFARNAAGFLRDSDSWVIESWMSGNTQHVDRRALSSERRFGNAGVEAVQRSPGRALGAVVNWTYYEQSDNPGDWAKVRGPVASALINQQFGAITVGALVGRETENEDRISEDFFSLMHKQSRWVGQLGVAYDMAGWTIAGAWDFERGGVEAFSVDPARFHEDEFIWTRPLDRYSVAVLMPSGGTIEGGVRAAFMDREGGEEMELSWSDRSPWNPSRSNYFEDVATFEESESESEILTQWRLHLGETMLSAEGAYRSWETEVREGINFKGSRREGASEESGVTFAAGASHRLFAGRLLVGAEGRVSQSDWEVSTATDYTEATSQTGSIRAGVEYFLGAAVAIRGGAFYGATDRDIDAPESLARLQGVTGGFSWLPSGGLVQVHGSLGYLRQEPWDDDAGDIEEIEETSYRLGLRLLL